MDRLAQDTFFGPKLEPTKSIPKEGTRHEGGLVYQSVPGPGSLVIYIYILESSGRASRGLDSFQGLGETSASRFILLRIDKVIAAGGKLYVDGTTMLRTDIWARE